VLAWCLELSSRHCSSRRDAVIPVQACIAERPEEGDLAHGFAAHSRAASEEMHALADELQTALRRIGQPTPDLDNLLSHLPPS